ncbi:MAG: 4Fe-4S binding protein [Azospirillaceae bacterium]|nr:4Fe-4S binding protein [Azospirillaceae bacterium]
MVGSFYRLRCITTAWAVGLAMIIAVGVGQADAADSHLTEYLVKAPLAEIMPGADRLGPVEGTPPAATAYTGTKVVGYVFLNADVVNATGYSGRPINVVIGIDTNGTITGAKLVEHHEPIVLIGIPEQKIRAFIDGFIGSNPAAGTFPSGGKGPDIISGATVTVMVLGDTINKSVLHVARSRGLGLLRGQAGQAVTTPRRGLALDQTGLENWQDLLGDGSVRRLHLLVADINKDFAGASDPRAAQRPEPGPDDDAFIDLYVALASAPVIGRSLLGEAGYADLRQQLAPGQQAVVVMGRGRYSFRGSGYVRGGIFDRIEVAQQENTVRFRDRDYHRLPRVLADGAPDFPEIGLFVVPQGSDFDPATAWRLTLLVQRQVGALDKVFISTDLPYQLPEKYLEAAVKAAPVQAGSDVDEPLWIHIWQQREVDIAILGASLLVLTGIFFFQDFMVRRPRLAYWVRTVFLLYTLFWIGWYANAQLSVVNVLNIANTVATGFHWDYFLMDPLIFVLWCATAASLLFWGRGAYCGWLCPFGALQEFTSRFARWVKLPQLSIPWAVHERLWPIKYILFLGLFGVSLYSLSLGERIAEIEPFKTAIILKFLRTWPFVVYAVAMVGGSLFVERFFCRYLCPLGAALAIPARIRMFDWLKRYRECGSPCQRCSNECPVQSIHPDGRINPNECIYCMHCQELYSDEHRCPVMIQRRLKRERRQSLSSPVVHPASSRAAATESHGEDSDVR